MEFQLDAICEEASDKGIEKALERVPDNMDATYERILNTINEKPRPKRELARKTLMWIAYARRPLSINELAYAISIEIDTKTLEDLESSTPPEEFILDACANLISVDTTYWGARYIRFVHFSVQEFLTSHRSTTFCMGYEAHREIAQACIILTLNIFPKQGDYKYQSDQNAVESLLKYSFKEWPRHLLVANINSLPANDDRVTFISSFFEEGPTMLTTLPKLDSQFSGYIANYPPDSGYIDTGYIDTGYIDTGYIDTGYIDTGFKFSPAVLALIFDLPGTEKCGQISREFEGKLSTTSDHDHNLIIMLDDNLAIHYATVELDSVPVVRRLYHCGYDLNYSHSDLNRAGKEVPDHLQLSSLEVPDYLQPSSLVPDHVQISTLVPDHLQISSLYSVRSIEMARYMLNNGISIAPQDLRSQLIDPLEYFATRSDLVGVFQLLLDRVVDQDGERLKGAMQTACHSYNLKAIRILVNKGFDIDNVEIRCSFGEYGSALQNAARNCQVKVVQLLLDEGADVNAQVGNYGYALQAAMAAKYTLHDYLVEVVQLLLDKGADVNAQGGMYGNALQAAAYSGKVEFFQLLLDKGADINAQGGVYGNALQAAADRGKVRVFQLLLDEGADVNAQGGVYGNALQAAAARGKVEVVQLLLDKGADVNAQGGVYGNALQAAAARDKVKVVQLLLDKEADVNAQGGMHGNALQAAAYDGKVEVVQLLLDKGADVNAQGEVYGNTLQAAAHCGEVEFFQPMLDRGVNVNAQVGIFGTVLQAAAYSGQTEVIHLVLDNGANIHDRFGKYGAALGHMLALEPVGTGQRVPGDIPLLVELLQEHIPIVMEQLPESEYEDIAESYVNEDRCSLDVFRGFLEEKGWKRGVPGSKEEESGTLEIERESDVVGGGVEHGNDDALVETPIKSGLKTIAHVWKQSRTRHLVLVVWRRCHLWKLLGFTFLMVLLYTLSFIGFWGA